MSSQIIAVGPPPLTVAAADAALDAIDFIAAAVRGVDLIDVTNTLRPLWRTHLANWYPYLPGPVRQWYAQGEATLSWIRTQWPLLYPVQHAMIVQQWSMALPEMLGMLDPVLAQAQALDYESERMRQQILAQIAQMRQQAAGWTPNETRAGATVQGQTPVPRSSAEAINELGRQADINIMLQNHATRMTELTRGLTRAMSSR